MISIRLSQSEYEELCRLSTITGARSLSDLTRDAMRSFLEKSTHDPLSTESLQGFQAQIDRLCQRIDELQDKLISPHPRPEEESS